MRAYAEVVFNMACPSSPIHYQSDPHATLTSSVLGALRIVEHARTRRCRVVHASTSEVYGDPLEHPQKEEYWGHVNCIGERSCYDEGKRVAETVLMDARRSHALDARIVRIFNTYGPRMAFNDGRVLSNFVMQVLEGRAITIYGDGQQSRSFCFVADLIEGLFRAGTVAEFDPPVNLGNPHEVSMMTLAEVVMAAVGKRVELARMPLPSDDPRRRCPDITKAKRLLGFEPRVPLSEGVRLTAENFRTRLALRESQA
jgi:UDP-glucuronate decarboxylase